MRSALPTIHIITNTLTNVKSVRWVNTLILKTLHARASTISQSVLHKDRYINKQFSHASHVQKRLHNTILTITNASIVPKQNQFLTAKLSFVKSVQKVHTITMKRKNASLLILILQSLLLFNAQKDHTTTMKRKNASLLTPLFISLPMILPLLLNARKDHTITIKRKNVSLLILILRSLPLLNAQRVHTTTMKRKNVNLLILLFKSLPIILPLLLNVQKVHTTIMKRKNVNLLIPLFNILLLLQIPLKILLAQ